MTIKEISKALGISISTVSKALNDYPDVNPKTKERILHFAKENGFVPNKLAASLRTKESKTVGLILPSTKNDFFNTILEGVLNAAEKANYFVLVLSSHESYEEEKNHVAKLLQQKVDGIFISLSEDTYDVRHLEEIQKSNTVLIQFDKISKIIDSSKVIINDRKAAYAATQHLIDIGKKNIVHLRGPLIPQVSIDRFLGYKSALENNGITFDPKLVVSCPKGTNDEGYTETRKLVENGIAFDAVFAHADLVAIGAINLLKEKQIKIPEEVSVVGFSNWLISSETTPSLTTVEQSGALIGQKIFHHFMRERLQKISSTKIEHLTEEIPTHLIKRESTRLSLENQ